MRYVILGTAGHIDHGKSSLVKALTGTDPDRLKEEKERGITIDLGFADLVYPDGLSIGIVDVPGHERLVRNMLAGAGGIDLMLLVIAADEGIMPQSREHLHICELLKIKKGIVAITKTDMVEPDWLELVKEEVKGFVAGTFLDGAPVIAVSSKTGDNLEALKDIIHDLALEVETKPTKGLFRLPIDRVFTLKGFGTVVTGTAVSGTVELEEQVEILPKGILTKVRGLHSHGKAMEKAVAGQRTAINLQSVEKDELSRGDTLVTAGRFTTAHSLDVKLELLADAPPVKNRSQVHFHLGTSETVARVILYETEQLGPGQRCYAQLRLQEAVVAQSGDRYIIRRFSPLETIGGGEVLDPSPARRRRKDGIDDLKVLEAGSLEERIEVKVRKASVQGMTRALVEGWVKAEVPAVRDAIGALKGKGLILKFEEILLHRDAVGEFRDDIVNLLTEFHKNNPLKGGMAKEEARTRLYMDNLRLFTSLLEMVDEVVQEKEFIRLKDFAAALSDEDKARVLAALKQKGVQTPPVPELAKEMEMDAKQLSDMFKLLAADGTVHRISDSLYIGREAYDGMMELLKAHYAKQDGMTVAEFRDLLGTTRKFALPLLEHLDANRITLRVGDIRKLLLK